MKKAKKRLTEDGLPVDALAWTEADWSDLFHAINRATKLIAARHKNDGDGQQREPVPADAKGDSRGRRGG